MAEMLYLNLCPRCIRAIKFTPMQSQKWKTGICTMCKCLTNVQFFAFKLVDEVPPNTQEVDNEQH